MVCPDQRLARRSRTQRHETRTPFTATAQAALLRLIVGMTAGLSVSQQSGAWRMRAGAAVALVLVLGVSGAAYAYAGPFVAGVFTPAQAVLGGVQLPASVPEPALLSLFGMGLFGTAFILRRRRRMKA